MAPGSGVVLQPCWPRRLAGWLCRLAVAARLGCWAAGVLLLLAPAPQHWHRRQRLAAAAHVERLQQAAATTVTMISLTSTTWAGSHSRGSSGSSGWVKWAHVYIDVCWA